MSLGVALGGTVFFGLLGTYADRGADFLHAAEVTTLVTAGLLALGFALAFALPRQARPQEIAAVMA
jgi:hypothetical protein